MPMVVNTNLGSLSVQRSLAASGVELKEAMERLSSGKKIQPLMMLQALQSLNA